MKINNSTGDFSDVSAKTNVTKLDQNVQKNISFDLENSSTCPHSHDVFLHVSTSLHEDSPDFNVEFSYRLTGIRYNRTGVMCRMSTFVSIMK